MIPTRVSKHTFWITILFVLLSFFAVISFVQAGTGGILSGNQYAQLMRDLDQDGENDRINFIVPSGSQVQITDTQMVGNLWGETIGWITLNPATGGVSNTKQGALSGYAWGESAGWINFNPTPYQVTIDTGTGEFSGYAWSQNFGWIEFSCPGRACVITDWRPTTSGGGGGGGGNPPSSPSCSLTLGNPYITQGESTILSWTSTNANISRTIDNGIGSVGASGSVTISPSVTTTYTGTFTGSGGTTLCQTTINVAELKSPGIIRFVNSSYSFDEDVGSGILYLVREDGARGKVAVQLNTTSGTATETLDYVGQKNIRVEWNNGETGIKAVPIPIIDDGTVEWTETFTATLKKSGAASLGIPSVATISIIDNDTALPQCSDNVDNDGDGLVDWPVDPGCDTPNDDDEFNIIPPPLPQCSDGVDNDGDNLIDYPDDPGCVNDLDDDESNEPPLPQCSDNVDNDGDGLVDWPVDPGCEDQLDDDEFHVIEPPLPQCSDTIDNDGDGYTDFPADPGCVNALDDNEENSSAPQPQCSDNNDNDGDGLVDWPSDPGCSDINDDDEFNVIEPPLPQCSDTIDNDGDGYTDFPADPGCVNTLDDNESDEPPLPQCSDNIDNDGDGLTDYPVDPGCTSNDDDDEFNIIQPPLPVCANGIDDDGDGLIDYPDDPGCVSTIDGDESNTTEGGGPSGTGGTGGGGTGTGGGSGPGGGGPPPGGGLSEIITGFIKKTAPNLISEIANILKKPATKLGLQFATGIGLLSGILVILNTIFSNPYHFWSLLLTGLGIKKRMKPWGTVYDSITKQPIDPAYVILYDQSGTEIATSITDLDGRYGFLASPGQYHMVAHKTNYAFPSSRLRGKTKDELYLDLYFGEPFTLERDGQVVTKNIPLDPENFDWNEFTKRKQHLMKFYSKLDTIIFYHLSHILFWFGFTASSLIFSLTPTLLNGIIVILYMIVAVLKETVIKPRAHGQVVGKDGLPLSFAIVRVFSARLDTEVTHKVCDKNGKYFCLTPKGQYYVKIEKKLDDGSYQHVYTSPVINVKRGIISKRFKV